MTDKDRDHLKEKSHPFYIKCINGGLAGMLSICIVQPADLLKTRMQLRGTHGNPPSVREVFRGIIKKSGFRGLYNGLSAAVFRQATYGTTRLGTFNTALDHYRHNYGPPPAHYKLACGMFAGGLAAFIGTPAEVCLIRMSGDMALPEADRRNYRHVFNALYRIVCEEGVLALWTGAASTISRAVVVNACELGIYAQMRETLVPVFGIGYMTFALSSMLSGLVTVTVSLPIDKVKTRVQNAPVKAHVTQIGVLRGILQKEGVLALWSGWLPTYGKIGPHGMFTFLFLETLNELYGRHVTGG